MNEQFNQTTIPRWTKETFTVHELMQEVKRLILEEPQRLDMRDWIISFAGLHLSSGWDISPESVPRPACGTVACLAGWITTLLRPENASPHQLDEAAESFAQRLLGHCGSQGDHWGVSEIFAPQIIKLDPDRIPHRPFPKPGTPELAQLIAARIDAYLHTYPEVATRILNLNDVHADLKERLV